MNSAPTPDVRLNPPDQGPAALTTTDRTQEVYPVLFIDCVHVKLRDGQVANRPIYVVLAVTVEDTREILGLWAGDGGEGAKYWLQVLTEIKNRGVSDVCMVVRDGLKGLPDAIETVWPQAITQTCVVHLLRASFRYAARQDWDKISKALKPVYTAATEEAATERFPEFCESRGRSTRRSCGSGRTPGPSSCHRVRQRAEMTAAVGWLALWSHSPVGDCA